MIRDDITWSRIGIVAGDMRRISIGLTDDQHERLRREASRHKLSVGALIRTAVERSFPPGAETRREARQRARGVFGTLHSGAHVIAEDRDAHLAALPRW